MAECRITVLKRTFDAGLAEEHLKQEQGPCPVFREGQEFVTSNAMERPQGFCDWAWNDIYRMVAVLSRGGNFSRGGDYDGWMKDDRSIIACCTDGIRPVIFRVERIG